MFTYAHVKWFYGQSERAYYLNYFIKVRVLRTLEKSQKHEPKASAFLHFSRVLKNSQLPIELSNALRAFFISLVNFFASSAKQQHEMTLR